MPETSSLEPVVYARCGVVSGTPLFSISSPEVSPLSVSEPLLNTGLAKLYLTMDMEWRGPTGVETVDIVGTPSLTKQVVNAEDVATTYNLTLGEGKIFGGASVLNTRITPNTKQIYAVINLNKPAIEIPGTASEKLFTELHFPLVYEMKWLKHPGISSSTHNSGHHNYVLFSHSDSYQLNEV